GVRAEAAKAATTERARHPPRAYKKKGRAAAAARSFVSFEFLRILRRPSYPWFSVPALTRRLVAHAHRDDADLLDAGPLGGIDDRHDVAVAQRRVADDEHRLSLARFEDVAQARLELVERDGLVVDGDRPVRPVFEDDLVVVGGAGLVLGFHGQVDVYPLLSERQGGHEDDQQDEEHVDERGDVHVRTGVRDLAGDDPLGAAVLVGVRHYFFSCLRSVIRAMFSICALRSASMASMIAAYFASLSPFR